MVCLRTAALFIVFLSSNYIQAKEPIVIVSDPWPPYSIKKGQNLVGSDVEITKEVFSQLKIPIIIKIYPWKRCLVMVENGDADSILDVSVTTERKSFLYFPDEPVSEGVTVFFIKKDSNIGLQNLNGLRAGAILGYSYCDEIDNSPFMIHAKRVASLEQNFKKLLANRIDFIIEVDAVGYYTAKSMGVSDHIKIIPNAYYCRSGNYMAFSKKPGHDQLAVKFSQALQKFKSTKTYHKILQKYGLKKP